MTRRRDPAQLSLLDLAPAPQRRGGVTKATYALIVALRKACIPVYAEGRHHRVGGRLLDGCQLRRFARMRGCV
jgi:hypothetical protein